MAVGSVNGPYHNYVEKYYPSQQTWRTAPNYPYHDVIGLAPVLHLNQAFYVVGGDTYGNGQQTIAVFKEIYYFFYFWYVGSIKENVVRFLS